MPNSGSLLIASLCLGLISQAIATSYSTEDESRFHSEPYKQAAPGFLNPVDYIERAKVILHSRNRNILLKNVHPDVTRRSYFDAPPADKEMICVRFEYAVLPRMPIAAMKRLPAPAYPCRAALLFLFRKDLSKIYVNEVYYQEW